MAGKNMKLIQERLAAEEAQLKVVQGRIEMLKSLLADMGAEVPDEDKVRTRAPRSQVKKAVLDLLEEASSSGLNAALAVEAAAKRGLNLERGSVSSLLSRLKNEGVVIYDNDRYRLKKFQKQQDETPQRPSASVFAHPASRNMS